MKSVEKKYTTLLKTISGETMSVRRVSTDDHRIVFWVPKSKEVLGNKVYKLENKMSELLGKYVKIFDSVDTYQNFVNIYKMNF